MVSPLVGVAVFSLVLCGLIFPLLVTGIGQAILPSQANGELVTVNGCVVGSNLIAQNFNSSVFFFPRPSGQSASGVDPDIPIQMAYDQIPAISNATGLTASTLKSYVDGNVEGTFWIFGDPYVNVLRLNVGLIDSHPSIYNAYVSNLKGSNCTKT